MCPKHQKRKDRSPYAIARLAKRKWFADRVLAVLERFITKERLRHAMRRLVRKNAPDVREILDIWETDRDRRELESLLLACELERPAPDTLPDCSIVIPVYNNADLTYSCLRALFLARNSATFEVVAVNNASTDHANEVLEYFGRRIRLIDNDKNRGFVEACNQGVAESRGRYIVFLNNDTRVADGWLDRLVETIESFPETGAVGAKLVFPDGTIQEAGGVIWNDGSGVNYGKWDDPDDLKYNFLREVDYCSAACLLVRRDLFERYGGFDMRYAPAFYEDTDLCFGLRDLGYRVLYQPLCEVEHHEGATAGTDLDLGFKRFQKVNRSKFTEKWAHELAARPAPSNRNLPAAHDRRKGKRILVIDATVPSYDRDSGSLRMFSILKALSQLGFVVTFLLRRRERLDRYGRALGGIGVRLVPEDKAWKELAAGVHDLVIVSRQAMAERYLGKVKRAAPRVPVVFDTVDVHFVREMRAAELSGDAGEKSHALRTRKEELAAARACDLTLAITRADRDHLRAADSGLTVDILPNVHAVPDAEPSPKGRRTLMFIGGFRHPPNVDAMIYFVGEVLPLIRDKVGNVELEIVGSDPPAEVRALASETISVTGWVPETAPYFRRARVFVSPLRYGSGMKGKIGEALSLGVPVVTTTIGAEGMDLVHGETALIRDDPESFAADVARLFASDDLWIELVRNGRCHVADNFGPVALKRRLEKILAAVLG